MANKKTIQNFVRSVKIRKFARQKCVPPQKRHVFVSILNS